MNGADRVVLAREDARSASNMLPMDFVPFLHNLYYMNFRVESIHTAAKNSEYQRPPSTVVECSPNYQCTSTTPDSGPGLPVVGFFYFR
jgi:hypothetical protein